MKEESTLDFSFTLMKMRNLQPILLFLIVLASCRPGDQNDLTDGSVVYKTTPVQSPSLLAKPTLRWNHAAKKMDLTLSLENLSTEKITITDVSFSNPGGMTSTAERLGIPNISLHAESDTSLQAVFTHVNDKRLFHMTGLNGLIDSTYTLSIFYTIDGVEGTRLMKLHSKINETDYVRHHETYDKPIRVYTLKTDSEFHDRQQQFLLSSIKTNVPPFVHVTEQEVAVSGLNFKVKCFHMNDSLYTEVFAVNHSEMIVSVDTARMHVIADGDNSFNDESISIEKVTGSKHEATVLGKGDRLVLQLRKKMQMAATELRLTFSESIKLANNRSLFLEDLRLVESE